MKYSKIAMSVLLALGIQSQAQGVDLIEIYHAAQSQDAVFASARATQQAGEEKLTQGRSLLMPSVNFNANTTKNDVTTTYAPGTFLSQFSGNSQYNSHGYGVSLVQPLFREQNWAAYNQAELQVAISEAQFKLAEQDVILRSAQTYFDVLIAQDTVQLTAAQKSSISQQLEQAKRNFEVGTATITDTYEAQARYDLIVAQELVSASNLEIKRRTLQQLINGDFNELNVLSSSFKLETPDPADVQKWVSDAQNGNFQVIQAQAAYQLAEREVDRNRGGHLPTVDLVANYSNNSVGGGTFAANTRSTAVGVQLNMPLFQGGAIQSKWREAGGESRKSQTGSGERAPQCGVANPSGLPGCGQRHRPGTGVAAGIEVQRKPAGRQQAGAGSGRAHQSGCAECATAIVFDTTRLIPGPIQLPRQPTALESSGRQPGRS